MYNYIDCPYTFYIYSSVAKEKVMDEQTIDREWIENIEMVNVLKCIKK